MGNNICAGIIVLYNPDLDILDKNIESIINQIDALWIVDNTPNQNIYSRFNNFSNVIYIPLGHNMGIAGAQNVAIKEIINNGYDFIYFLDQDSISPKDIVSRLKQKFYCLLKEDILVGGIGPRPFNREQGQKYLGSIKRGIPVGNGLSEVSELINSGSMIPISVFSSSGLMDETLFIDGVDHEFCWRARVKGKYRFFIDEETLLSHKLGEGDKKLGGKRIAIPTPFRTYYQFRNYFILSKRSYVPLYWKFSNGFKYLIKIVYYPLFVSPRKAYVKNIFRGIRDGFKSIF